jgi:predicted RNase H-like nuclease (RuvC/YqgF family)
MQASTAQVRVVKSPNKYAKDCVRILVAFNVGKVNSKNAVYVSGDLFVDDVPKMIIRAVDIVRAEDFVVQA